METFFPHVRVLKWSNFSSRMLCCRLGCGRRTRPRKLRQERSRETIYWPTWKNRPKSTLTKRTWCPSQERREVKTCFSCQMHVHASLYGGRRSGRELKKGSQEILKSEVCQGKCFFSFPEISPSLTWPHEACQQADSCVAWTQGCVMDGERYQTPLWNSRRSSCCLFFRSCSFLPVAVVRKTEEEGVFLFSAVKLQPGKIKRKTVCESAADSVQCCTSCKWERATCQRRRWPKALTASQTGDDKLWPGVTRWSDTLLQRLGCIM